MIVAMGTAWSLLWNQPLQKLMPFIGIGLVIWSYSDPNQRTPRVVWPAWK